MRSAGSHSGGQSTHAAEYGLDRPPPGAQQLLHAHSGQEGYRSEEQAGGEGEVVGGQQPNGEGKGFQQPQEQHHQSLTGDIMSSMLQYPCHCCTHAT